MEDSQVLQPESQAQKLCTGGFGLKEAPASKKESNAREARPQLGRSLHNNPGHQTRQLRAPNRGGKNLATYTECGSSEAFLPVGTGL